MNIIETSLVKDMKQNGTSLCYFHFQMWMQRSTKWSLQSHFHAMFENPAGFAASKACSNIRRATAEGAEMYWPVLT